MATNQLDYREGVAAVLRGNCQAGIHCTAVATGWIRADADVQADLLITVWDGILNGAELNSLWGIPVTAGEGERSWVVADLAGVVITQGDGHDCPRC